MKRGISIFFIFVFSGIILQSFYPVRVLSQDTIPPLSIYPLPSYTKNYPGIQENDLFDTRWQYAYATYTGSKTKIFPATESNNHFVWLKLDYTFEQVSNGQRTFGMWQLNKAKNQLYYKYKNIKWWEIVRYEKDTLVLEFADSYESLQYTFVKLAPGSAPFGTDNTILPVFVKSDKKKKYERKGRKRGVLDWMFSEPGVAARDTTIHKPVWVDPNPEPQAIPIEIILIGGGYYGGIDPVIKNYIQIKTTGRVIRDMKHKTRAS
jgi:hypothetical protein